MYWKWKFQCLVPSNINFLMSYSLNGFGIKLIMKTLIVDPYPYDKKYLILLYGFVLVVGAFVILFCWILIFPLLKKLGSS
jgi:hypothetical protein